MSDLARDFEGSGKEWRAPPVFSGQRPLPPELPPAGAPATPADADFERDLADVCVELAAVRDAEESPVPLTTTDPTPAPNGARRGRGGARRHPTLRVGPRALEVYRLWVAHLLAHQRPPSYRELVAALGMRSPHAVAQHLAALVREGLLERVPGAVKTGTHPCPHRLAGVTLRLEYADGPAGERARLALEGDVAGGEVRHGV